MRKDGTYGDRGDYRGDNNYTDGGKTKSNKSDLDWLQEVAKAVIESIPEDAFASFSDPNQRRELGIYLIQKMESLIHAAPRLGIDRGDLSGILHSTLVKIRDKLPLIKEKTPGGRRAWCAAVISNALNDHWRLIDRLKETPLECKNDDGDDSSILDIHPDENWQPDEALVNSERQTELVEALNQELDKLSSSAIAGDRRQAQLLRYYYLEEKTSIEIMNLCGINENQLHLGLSRGRKILGEMLLENHGDLFA